MTHREEFRAYMKAANSTPANYEDRHLSEARMLAYCRGEMAAMEREAAEAHLVGCEQCIALFRNARDFLDPARADEEDISAAETNAAWSLLLQRVQTAASERADGAGTNVAPGDFQRPREGKFFSASRVALALAASLLIFVGALGWLGWRLWQERQSRRHAEEAALQLTSKQQELEQRISQLEQRSADALKRERDQRLAAEAERDQLETQLASVEPARPSIPVYTVRLSSDRGAEEGDLSLRLTAAAAAARLRLLIAKPDEFQEYTVELLGHRGEVVREISGLRPAGDDRVLLLRLNRAMFTSGKYTLRLFGVSGEAKKQLGEYGLSVTVDR